MIVALLFAGAPAPAGAALDAVAGLPAPRTDAVTAGGAPANVAYSLANGFPLWFRDGSGVKLALCLDQQATLITQTVIAPCLTSEPFPGAPISFPNNFGPEAFWWTARAFTTFNSEVDGRRVAGSALLVLAQEAAFNLGAGDGEQVAFGRIRLRIDVPVPGTYRVTHPYGEVDYVVTAAGSRAINQTQDIGSFLLPGAPPAGNFLLALANGPDPATVVRPLGFPAVNAGIVAQAATGIGPFLIPAPPLPPFLATLDGSRYLADPGSEPTPQTVPVIGSPTGANHFRIRLLDPPAGVLLNADAGSQEILVERFQLAGKLFADAANDPPVARPDRVATGKDTPLTIDVLANDSDEVRLGNIHGINPQALGLPTDPADLTAPILLTKPLTTASGGSVERFTALPTGKTTFIYTPAAGFTGTDSFTYAVQDTGGLLATATVTVTVEEVAVAAAEYRARTGKWRIAGTSTERTANTITLLADPRARLSGAGAAGTAVLRPAGDRIDFRLALDPLPAAAVTAVRIHLGAPGENGPPIFFLYDSLADGPLGGQRSGLLTTAQLLPQPAQGIHTFGDAVAAILAGNACVQVATPLHPAGEIGGRLTAPVIGTAPVHGNGEWIFAGKAKVSPGGVPANVHAVSANGIRVIGRPLQLK